MIFVSISFLCCSLCITIHRNWICGFSFHVTLVDKYLRRMLKKLKIKDRILYKDNMKIQKLVSCYGFEIPNTQMSAASYSIIVSILSFHRVPYVVCFLLGVWGLKTDVSEPSIGSIFLGRWRKNDSGWDVCVYLYIYAFTCLGRWNREGSETSAFKPQMPGKYPKENILHKEHGESLKSRHVSYFLTTETDKNQVASAINIITLCGSIA